MITRFHISYINDNKKGLPSEKSFGKPFLSDLYRNGNYFNSHFRLNTF